MAFGMTSRDAVEARNQTLGAAQSLLASLAADLRETGMMRSTALEQTHAVQAGADRTLANINAALGEPAPMPAPGQQPAMQTGLSPDVLAQARNAVAGAGNTVQKIDSVLQENTMDSTKWRDTVGAPGARPKGATGPER